MTIITRPMAALYQEGATRMPMAMANPKIAFAGLLANVQGRPQAETRETFTFAELGMFGCHGCLISADKAGDGKQPSSVLGPIQDQGGKNIHPNRHLPVNAAAPTQTPSGGSLHLTSLQALKLSQATVLPENCPADLPDPQMPMATLGIQDGKGKTPSGPPIMTGAADKGHSAQLTSARPAPMVPSGAINLVVNASGNAAKIIARSEAGTPDARMRLRRLMTETLAEFGLNLDSLHIDGSEEGPSFPSITGGNHGARQR